tara:strand:- start:73 stop:768 length:696 start_codon:yes stop_codon:yes gene_type:complete
MHWLLSFLQLSVVIYSVLVFYLLKIIYIILGYLFSEGFNEKNRSYIKIFGGYKIKKMYVAKEKVRKLYHILFKVLTFNTINKALEECEEKTPYHSVIYLELENEVGDKKKIRLEKHYDVDMIVVDEFPELNKVKVKVKKGMTLKNLLRETEERIGEKKFFNWHICENNCQNFAIEILKTGECLNENLKREIFQDFFVKEEFWKKIFFPDLTKTFFNVSSNLITIISKFGLI